MVESLLGQVPSNQSIQVEPHPTKPLERPLHPDTILQLFPCLASKQSLQRLGHSNLLPQTSLPRDKQHSLRKVDERVMQHKWKVQVASPKGSKRSWNQSKLTTFAFPSTGFSILSTHSLQPWSVADTGIGELLRDPESCPCCCDISICSVV